MNNYVNLHTHSVYSMLDGLGQIDAYMKRASELKMPALGLSDHGVLHGWLDFYEAGEEHGVKPILGAELYQARKTRFDRDEEELAGKATSEFDQRGPYHLTVHAQNMDGYKNLIKLSSKSFLEGFFGKQRIDFELLEQHSKGLIVLSGCLGGGVCQALLRDDYDAALAFAAKTQDIVGKDNYFIEVMYHGMEEEAKVIPDLVKISKAIGAKIVPTGDSHYVHKDDADAHDTMLCLSTGAKKAEEERFKFLPYYFYLKSYDEMLKNFDAKWLKNTVDIAESVDLKLSFGELYFPKFPIPTEETPDEYLERKVWEGISERYGDNPSDKIKERVQHELRVVRKMGFQEYFLVVSDIIGWAKEQGIPVGWGRGSAAGSILSYALKITNLDPMRFNLLFERFLVEGRKSMPDIDLDIDDRRRHEVIEYTKQKYGEEKVAHIATFSTEKGKQAIRDATRVLEYDYAIGDQLSKLYPKAVLGVERSINGALKTSAEMRNMYENKEDIKNIIDGAKSIEGVYRQSGIHAGGIIIAQSDITDFAPVMRRHKDKKVGPTTTQWDMHRVEQIGLLKIDFLGLRNLGIIDMCVDNIRNHKSIEVDIDNIPLDDEATYKELCAGRSVGIFQIESPGMREMTVAVQPNRIEDIMAIVSLYRPGPLGSGIDKLYISRKHGRSKPEAYHPVLTDILEPTYGTMLYQDDVLAVARNLAGFTAAEADDLRKAIGKKLMDKIGLFREKFVQGCYDTHKVKPDLANKIYSDIEYFGGYGFNLAHAASYAMVSYITAYLKVHYPAEYMAALLTSVKNREAATPYLNECRSMGLKVLPPSINKSNAEFKVESDKEILFGLASIDGIGPEVTNALLHNRKQFNTVYDFMRRGSYEAINKKALERLIWSGAFDELAPEQKHRTMLRSEKMELLDIERQQLGLYVTEHPLSGVWPSLEPNITTTITDIELHEEGEVVTIAGVLSRVEKKETKANKTYYVLMVEDVTSEIEVLVFPVFIKDNTFKEGEIMLITGRIKHEGDEDNVIYKIHFNSMKKPEIPEMEFGDPIFITCATKPSYDNIKRINNLISKHSGDCPVYLKFEDDGRTMSFMFKNMASQNIRDQLQLLGSLTV